MATLQCLFDMFYFYHMTFTLQSKCIMFSFLLLFVVAGDESSISKFLHVKQKKIKARLIVSSETNFPYFPVSVKRFYCSFTE